MGLGVLVGAVDAGTTTERDGADDGVGTVEGVAVADALLGAGVGVSERTGAGVAGVRLGDGLGTEVGGRWRLTGTSTVSGSGRTRK